jgi:HSP20 family molecular chaperone IbpA
MQLSGIKEEDIVIDGENSTLHVRAFTTDVTVALDENPEVNGKFLLIDKTVVLEDDADVKNMTSVFFAGMLEVTVPKIKL